MLVVLRESGDYQKCVSALSKNLSIIQTPPLPLEKFSGSAHAVGLRRHIQPPLHLE